MGIKGHGPCVRSAPRTAVRLAGNTDRSHTVSAWQSRSHLERSRDVSSSRAMLGGHSCSRSGRTEPLIDCQNSRKNTYSICYSITVEGEREREREKEIDRACAPLKMYKAPWNPAGEASTCLDIHPECTEDLPKSKKRIAAKFSI